MTQEKHQHQHLASLSQRNLKIDKTPHLLIPEQAQNDDDTADTAYGATIAIDETNMEAMLLSQQPAGSSRNYETSWETNQLESQKENDEPCTLKINDIKKKNKTPTSLAVDYILSHNYDTLQDKHFFSNSPFQKGLFPSPNTGRNIMQP